MRSADIKVGESYLYYPDARYKGWTGRGLGPKVRKAKVLEVNVPLRHYKALGVKVRFEEDAVERVVLPRTLVFPWSEYPAEEVAGWNQAQSDKIAAAAFTKLLTDVGLELVVLSVTAQSFSRLELEEERVVKYETTMTIRGSAQEVAKAVLRISEGGS
jgi:hypothetical protein